MIPIKDKTYQIAYRGLFEYDGYIGRAICTNDTPDIDGWYEFTLIEPANIPNTKGILFAEEEIVALVETP